MAEYTVQDTTTGKTIKFQWNAFEPPTDDDMEEVFDTARNDKEWSKKMRMEALEATQPVAEAPPGAAESPNLFAAKEAVKVTGQTGLEIAGSAVGGMAGAATGVPGLGIAGGTVGYVGGKRLGESLGLSEEQAPSLLKDIGFGLAQETGARFLHGAGKYVLGKIKKMTPEIAMMMLDVPTNLESEALKIVGEKLPHVNSWKEHLVAKSLERSIPTNEPLKSIVKKNIGEALDIEQTIPGAKFSLSSQTGLGGIIGAEKALVARSKEAMLAKEQQFYETNAAIRNSIESIDTKQKGIQDVLDKLTSKRAALGQEESAKELALKKAIGDLDLKRIELADQANKNLQKIKQELGGQPGKEEIGKSQRGVVVEVKKELEDKSEQLYGKIPKNIIMEDSTPLISRAQDILEPHDISVLYDKADRTAKSILNKFLKESEGDLTEGPQQIPLPNIPPKGISPKPATSNTFISWLRNEGGIWDESLLGEMNEFTQKQSGVVGLVNKDSGIAFDELAARAREAGWLGKGATGEDLRELLRKDVIASRIKGGNRIRPTGQEKEPMPSGEEMAGQVVAADLQTGDSFIMNGEKFTHKGFDKDGNIILEDGKRVKVDPFEKLEIERLKYKTQKPVSPGTGEDIPGEAELVPQPITSGELRELDKFINKVRRSLIANRNVPGNPELAWRLGKLKEGINETYDAYAQSTGNENLKKVISDATSFTRETFAPLFRSNAPSNKVLAKDYSGRYRISDTEIGSAFFVPGEKGIAAVDNYKTVFKGDMEPLKNYATADLLDTAYNDVSGWSVAGATRWFQSHAYALKRMDAYDMFKGTIEEISKAGNIKASLPKIDPKGLKEAVNLAEITLKKQNFETSAAGRVLGGDAEKAIDNAIAGNTNNVRNAIKQLKDYGENDPDFINGLRREMLNYVQRKWQSFVNRDIDKNPLAVLSKTEQLFRDLRPGFEELFSKQELNILEKSRDAIYLMTLQGKNVVSGSETAMFIKEGAMRDVRRAISLAAGMSGYPARVPEWLLSKLSAVGVNKYDEVMAKAIYDPEYGKMILKALEDSKAGKPVNEIARGFYKSMLIAGTTYIIPKKQEELGKLPLATSSGAQITQ